MSVAKAEIGEALAVTAELLGTELTTAALREMARHLANYPADQVRVALSRCQLELRGRLTLAEILDRLPDGRPGPEEAWSMVATVTDQDTVVWTTEIAEAWAAARFLLDEPVQARMAFLEVYRQRIAMGRSNARAPQWQIYLGYDVAQRAPAIFAALEAGRIHVPQAQNALPPHEWPATWSPRRELPAGEPAPVTRAEVAGLVLGLATSLDMERKQQSLPPAEEGTIRKALEDKWEQGGA
jgi:hypothetical protein